MAEQVFGLDFGTTNSLLSVIGRDGRPIYVTDETDRPHPSVVWYRGAEVVVGRNARENLDAGAEPVTGSFVRSPKRLLDTDAPIHVAGMELDPRDIIAEVIKFLIADATNHPVRQQVDRVVMTIPVKLDGAGRRRLRDAARKAQIGIVQFVHEPLAALYAYLRSQSDYRRRLSELDGCRILVFDWGGGTLDLTLCEVHHNQIIQIANAGDDEVGGNRFDELIRNQVREAHARQHGIEDLSGLERDEARIVLLNQCELRKIDLSEREVATVFVRNYLRHESSGRDLSVSISASDLRSWTGQLIDRGLGAIDALLEQNHLSYQQIALCLPTGGMINVPAIRDGLRERFGARSPRLNNADRIISEGAAWIAHDDLRLALAKPIELLQSDDTYAPVVPLPFMLPLENQSIPAASAVYRCVDPRPGRASFTFARPRRLRARDARSERQVYATFQLDVDENATPLMERLELNLTIDHDYVAHVDLYSTMRQQRLKAEIFDLEFTLAFSVGAFPETKTPETNRETIITPTVPGSAESTAHEGRVRLRSNISASDSWENVPGDLVLQYRPNWFDERTRSYSDWQKQEWTYYKDCPYCHRRRYQYWTEGCNAARCLWRSIYPVKGGPNLSRGQAIRVVHTDAVDQESAETSSVEHATTIQTPIIEPSKPVARAFAANSSLSANELGAPQDAAASAPLPATITVSSPRSLSQEDDEAIELDESDGQTQQRTPRKYRVAPRKPRPARSADSTTPDASGELRQSDRTFSLDVRLTYEKAGFCRISLLPRRAAHFPDDLEVSTGDASYWFVTLQEQWYQDVIPQELGILLQEGVEWGAQLPDGRRAQWSLAGRPIYVLGHHDRLSGYVATQRLTIGEDHVVLCLDERLHEVKEAIDLAGSPPPIELTEANGLPDGWVGLRGVMPRRYVPPSPVGGILDVLRPLADVRISFEGGIRIDRQTWLHGYPPRILLHGDTTVANDLLIDGSPASLSPHGSYEVNGWDSPGEHSVWCPSASRSYLICDGAETWDPWNAHTSSIASSADQIAAEASICGALVRRGEKRTLTGRAAVVPISNSLILGANPGEIETCWVRQDLRVTCCMGFPSFDPVWALPADPQRSSKDTGRVLLIGDPLPVGRGLVSSSAEPQSARQALRRLKRWCSAIRSAGQKGLRTEPNGSDIVAIWQDYKKKAKTIARRSR